MPASARRSVLQIETYWTPRTPFCVSSGDGCLIDLSGALTHQSEQFARDVTLQAADCLRLGVALGDAFRHVGLGPRFRPQPADGDDVQGTVGCPVAASVEAMAGGLARRGRDRTHPAQRGKACLGPQTLWIVAGGEEELRRGAMADRVPRQERGGQRVEDGNDHGAESADLSRSAE